MPFLDVHRARPEIRRNGEARLRAERSCFKLNLPVTFYILRFRIDLIGKLCNFSPVSFQGKKRSMFASFTRSRFAIASLILALCGASAAAQNYAKIGVLSCDVSAGVGMIIVQKQSLNCVFRSDNGAPPDAYIGAITEYGVALGEVAAGHLIWGVLASVDGVPHGALAGFYSGVGAEAAVGAGVGGNALIGGSERAFSLQPISVEGQIGINVAAGITAITLSQAH
jgi:hypothetical protein